MTLFTETKTIIDSVRIRVNRNSDPLATELRLSGVFSTMELSPPGLASSAIVIINRLKNPLPGGLSLRDQGVIRAWERSVNDAVASLVRKADRPALGAVPANSEAVLFSDRAEFLACLASDWCDESVIEHWWWRSLLKGRDIRSLLMKAWLDAPEYAPAALEWLAQHRKAVPFVCRLSDDEAKTLLNRITRSFALDKAGSMATALASPGGSPVFPGELASTGAEAPDAQVRTDLGGEAPGPRLASECFHTGLTSTQRCLLGVTLALVRAPAAVRSPEFARILLRSTLDRGQVASEVQGNPSATVQPNREVSYDMPEVTCKGLSPGKESRRHSKAKHTSAPSLALSDPLSGPETGQSMPAEEAAVSGRGVGGHLKTGDQAEQIPAAGSPPLACPTARADVGQAFRSPLLEAAIETELGGLFYLINLGIFLELYGDFTAPIRPGIALSIWDFVTLAGRRLVGDGWQDDPLWQLLARLAGRGDGEAPGEDFDPPDHWRLPAGWLKSFPEEGPWQWSTAGGRLRAQHPEGFPVLDLALEEAAPLAQAEREARAYGYRAAIKPGAASWPGGSQSGTSLERWLEWLMPYLRSRLGRALGCGDAADLPRMLCRQKARVSATATHVDVFFALDLHPIEIRLAGLDRDPGWVPAAGRCIAFHYRTSADLQPKGIRTV